MRNFSIIHVHVHVKWNDIIYSILSENISIKYMYTCTYSTFESQYTFFHTLIFVSTKHSYIHVLYLLWERSTLDARDLKLITLEDKLNSYRYMNEIGDAQMFYTVLHTC